MSTNQDESEIQYLEAQIDRAKKLFEELDTFIENGDLRALQNIRPMIEAYNKFVITSFDLLTQQAH